MHTKRGTVSRTPARRLAAARRGLPPLLFAAALLALLALPVRAAEGVQIRLTADRQELTVGDPVLVTLEVTHPAGTQVIIPNLEQGWGDLEVQAQSPATTVADGDGSQTTRQTMQVTLFTPGRFEAPPLTLTLSSGDGQVSEETTPSLSLTVTPTLAEEDTDLRDIKPQAALALPALWPWIAGGVLAAVLIAVAGWWAYRRLSGRPFLAPAVDNRPAWQVAYDELARIAALDLPEQGRFKEHYTLLADCLRAYLAGHFHLRTFDRTTSQLQAALRGSELAPEHSRRFVDLFAASDLVKFAKLTPEVPAARQALAEARQLVDLTRPGPDSDLERFMDADKPPVAPAARPRLSYQSGQ